MPRVEHILCAAALLWVLFYLQEAQAWRVGAWSQWRVFMDRLADVDTRERRRNALYFARHYVGAAREVRDTAVAAGIWRAAP